MSVYCAKTDRLIAGVKPVRMIAKKRNVTYRDVETGKEASGWEIAQEIWVHPDVAEVYQNETPEVVGSVVKEVRMTKPRSKYIRDREYGPDEEY